MKLTELQEAILGIARDIGGYGANCSRSARRHLERAWVIKDIDPEMAMFHAITAQEEACAALFYGLRRMRYDGARRLNANDHDQKAAVEPFFRAVSGAMIPVKHLRPELIVEKHESGDILKNRITVAGPGGEPYHAYPDPPLNFSIDQSGQRYDFRSEMATIVSKANVNTMQEHVRRGARLRNRLLYATPNGIPTVQGDTQAGLEKYRRFTFVVLGAYVFIVQPDERQEFVQQCLNAFLAMLNDLRGITRDDSGHR